MLPHARTSPPEQSENPPARRGAGWWIPLLPVLACCGVHVLLAGALVAGLAILGAVGAAAVAALGVTVILWWRRRTRCPDAGVPGRRAR